ncbi:MAG: hypothetical protein NVSMB66_2830 [Candidatus Doudnabacteria bacterium]
MQDPRPVETGEKLSPENSPENSEVGPSEVAASAEVIKRGPSKGFNSSTPSKRQRETPLL